MFKKVCSALFTTCREDPRGSYRVFKFIGGVIAYLMVGCVYYGVIGLYEKIFNVK